MRQHGQWAGGRGKAPLRRWAIGACGSRAARVDWAPCIREPTGPEGLTGRRLHVHALSKLNFRAGNPHQAQPARPRSVYRVIIAGISGCIGDAMRWPGIGAALACWHRRLNINDLGKFIDNF